MWFLLCPRRLRRPLARNAHNPHGTRGHAPRPPAACRSHAQHGKRRLNAVADRSACLFYMAKGGDGRGKAEEEEKEIHTFCSFA
jgi:hypothetical protein